MINYNIPGCYEHAKLNLAFIDYFKEYPERFIDNVNIESCFGNFQYCIFDGGRIFFSTEQCGKEQVEKIVSMFNNRNIPVRLVFTNKKLQPYHYYDEFSNIINALENEKKEVEKIKKETEIKTKELQEIKNEKEY